MRGLDALAGLLGDDLAEHEPWRYEGVAPRHTATPGGAALLARTLETADAQGLAAVVRGGGSALGLGNLPSRADFVLDTAGLAGIEELDLEDAVVKAGAGTPLADVQAAAAPAGLELGLDPFGEHATVGGVLASARFGPRRLGLGPVRDCVLGLEVVLATGERTRCGGRVVKNVTGYDLAKLHTGAFGTLGVIASAWLRLRARPEASALWWAPLPGGAAAGEDALARTLEASRLAAARACALAGGEFAHAIAAPVGRGGAPGEAFLLVELAGDEPVVARDAAWLRDALGAEPVAEPDAVLAAWRARQGARAPVGAAGTPLLRARVGVPPSRMAAASERLSSSVTGTLAQPGIGALWVELPAGVAGDAPSLERSLGQLDAAVTALDATLQLEALPQAAKLGRDVFALPAATRRLMARVAREFDPRGVLNPGRLLARAGAA